MLVAALKGCNVTVPVVMTELASRLKVSAARVIGPVEIATVAGGGNMYAPPTFLPIVVAYKPASRKIPVAVAEEPVRVADPDPFATTVLRRWMPSFAPEDVPLTETTPLDVCMRLNVAPAKVGPIKSTPRPVPLVPVIVTSPDPALMLIGFVVAAVPSTPWSVVPIPWIKMLPMPDEFTVKVPPVLCSETPRAPEPRIEISPFTEVIGFASREVPSAVPPVPEREIEPEPVVVIPVL